MISVEASPTWQASRRWKASRITECWVWLHLDATGYSQVALVLLMLTPSVRFECAHCSEGHSVPSEGEREAQTSDQTYLRH